MPKRSYALEAAGPKRLNLSWGSFWKNMIIRLDGNEVGTIPERKELQAGQDLQLPDGSTLRVQLINKAMAPELVVLRDGRPLPGSDTDPGTRVKTARNLLFWIAGLNLVLGLIAVILEVEFLRAIGIGVYSILFGIVFLALGFLVRRGSVAALIIATVLFAVDGLLGIVGNLAAGYTPGIPGLVVRVFLVIYLVQGIGAMRAAKQEAAQASAS